MKRGQYRIHVVSTSGTSEMSLDFALAAGVLEMTDWLPHKENWMKMMCTHIWRQCVNSINSIIREADNDLCLTLIGLFDQKRNSPVLVCKPFLFGGHRTKLKRTDAFRLLPLHLTWLDAEERGSSKNRQDGQSHVKGWETTLQGLNQTIFCQNVQNFTIHKWEWNWFKIR